MEYLTYPEGEWIDTGIDCPRCGNIILRETIKLTHQPTDHFACNREGCTWPTFAENREKLINMDKQRIGKYTTSLSAYGLGFYF